MPAAGLALTAKPRVIEAGRELFAVFGDARNWQARVIGPYWKMMARG